MKNLSWQELNHCQTYAEAVVERYKKLHKGAMPMCMCEAEYEVRKYNRNVCSFQSMFGYSIRGYVEEIVLSIGLMVEGEMNE